MKKNLISIVILALMVVNVILSAITLISVASTNSKTAKLVGDIAAAIHLDLGSGDLQAGQQVVPMSDTETYDITEMTIPLKAGEDGESHFALISFTISMNSKDKDYKTYGETLSSKEGLIKGEISEVVSQYTMEEAENNERAIEDEILSRLQTMFASEFIYNVTISSTMYQ